LPGCRLAFLGQGASLPFAYELCLPKERANDPARREKAGGPQEIESRTKLQPALNQIEAAHRAGLELGMSGADAAYGELPDFRDALTALGLPYCVGVRERTTIWPERKGPLPPKPYSGRGERPKLLRRDQQHRPVSVKELALSLPEKQYLQVAGAQARAGS
jgi:SRSO17 transposase